MVSTSIDEKPPQRAQVIFWFTLSLVAAAYFGITSLQYVLSHPYMVQDDARHHVTWMQQFSDPQLFKGDLIGDYFSSVAPRGFRSLYWLMAQVGIEPLMLAKLVPLLLSLISAAYGFGICLEAFPVPAGAFLSSLLLTQMLWLKDDIISATPRAFLYPFLLAFIYYLQKRSVIPCLVAIALQGLFYPQIMLLQIAVLTVRLFRWQPGGLQLSRQKMDYIFWLAGCGVACGVLLPFIWNNSQFGPVATGAQMQAMPEFGNDGRVTYFVSNPLEFWIYGNAGISPPIYPPVLACLLLPRLIQLRFPLTAKITNRLGVLNQLLIASFVMFGLAHLLLFKLYLPSRYTQHSLVVIMTLISGIVLTILLDEMIRWLRTTPLFSKAPSLPLPARWHRFALRGIGLLITASLGLAMVPYITVSAHLQVEGQMPTVSVYEFFSRQPKSTLVASLVGDATNIPSFAKRSILVSEEFAISFHLGFYNQYRQRTIDLLQAQYSADLGDVKRLIEKYRIDFFWVDLGAFTPGYITDNHWLMQYQPVATEVAQRVQQGQVPALSKLVERCSVLKAGNTVVLPSACIMSSASSSSGVKL